VLFLIWASLSQCPLPACSQQTVLHISDSQCPCTAFGHKPSCAAEDQRNLVLVQPGDFAEAAAAPTAHGEKEHYTAMPDQHRATSAAGGSWVTSNSLPGMLTGSPVEPAGHANVALPYGFRATSLWPELVFAALSKVQLVIHAELSP
jgi:hypothetical protein